MKISPTSPPNSPPNDATKHRRVHGSSAVPVLASFHLERFSRPVPRHHNSSRPPAWCHGVSGKVFSRFRKKSKNRPKTGKNQNMAKNSKNVWNHCLRKNKNKDDDDDNNNKKQPTKFYTNVYASPKHHVLWKFSNHHVSSLAGSHVHWPWHIMFHHFENLQSFLWKPTNSTVVPCLILQWLQLFFPQKILDLKEQAIQATFDAVPVQTTFVCLEFVCTLPETNSKRSWKMVNGRLLSFWKPA